MAALVKARLIELNQKFDAEKPGGAKVTVQFNPETLKVTYANQIEQPKSADQASGTAGRQYVGTGTTKLALTLWFDVTAMEDDPVDDVRRLTQQVIYFMTPQPSDFERGRLAPPGLRFQWGSFLFDGMVDGLEQSLEYFSPDGKPLRASIGLSMSQQKILEAKFQGDGHVPKTPGRAPLTPARSGATLQGMVGLSGTGADWQSVAAANGIEDPLRLSAGAMIDLSAGTGGASVGASVSIGFGT